jgi:hypothetical protein
VDMSLKVIKKDLLNLNSRLGSALNLTPETHEFIHRILLVLSGIYSHLEHNTQNKVQVEMHPRVGAIAYCRNGCLGLITGKQALPWPNEPNEWWVGIHLGKSKPGRYSKLLGTPWQSKNPEVVGYIEELIKAL